MTFRKPTEENLLDAVDIGEPPVYATPGGGALTS